MSYEGNRPDDTTLERDSTDPKVWKVKEDGDFAWTGSHDFTGATVSGISGGGGVPTTRMITAGAGLTGGGDLSVDRTLAVGAGNGIIANADDIEVNTTVIQAKSEKGAASGYAELDGSALVPTAQLGTGTANSSKFLRGDRTWQTPVAAGVTSKWAPWVPPSSPHALDDEFDDSSLDVKWSTWNPATLLTVTEDPKGLKLAGTDDPASSHSVMGLFQAIGADDEYEIVTRAAVTTSLGDGGLAGLLLLQDPDVNPTTSDFLHFYVRSGTTGPDIVGINRHAAYNAAPAVVATNEYRASNVYLLLQYKKTGNLYSAWRSSDGVGWTSLVRATSPVFTPGFLGVGINPFQRDMYGRFEFFRVRSAASGLYDVFPEPLGG
jgi:hypothetical protein